MPGSARVKILAYAVRNFRFVPVTNSAYLRLYASCSFRIGNELVTGGPVDSNLFFIQLTVPVVNLTNASGLLEPSAQIPAFEIVQTEDGDRPVEARWTAAWYDISGNLAGVWKMFQNFKVPGDLGTLNVVSGLYEASWDQVRHYNQDGTKI
jgi:hypothetical protein